MPPAPWRARERTRLADAPHAASVPQVLESSQENFIAHHQDELDSEPFTWTRLLEMTPPFRIRRDHIKVTFKVSLPLPLPLPLKAPTLKAQTHQGHLKVRASAVA